MFSEVQATPPPPYQGEVSSGGTRFQHLLAMSNRAGRPDSPTQQRDKNAHDEQSVGSPHVPDPPLRQEMPGLQMPPMGQGEHGSGRFAQMMSQAQIAKDRQEWEAEHGPPESRAPRPPVKRYTRDEKETAMRAAVERQQKLMSSAQGIDLDADHLTGRELQMQRAITRAQAESKGSGYVPSSPAADDYMNSLKQQSKKMKIQKQRDLRGLPQTEMEPDPADLQDPQAVVPPPPLAQQSQPAVPQPRPTTPAPRVPMKQGVKRTKASVTVQNESDVYIASLSGLNAEIKKNPYLDSKPAMEQQQQLEQTKVLPTASLGYKERLAQAAATKASRGSPSTSPAQEVVQPQQQAPNDPAITDSAYDAFGRVTETVEPRVAAVPPSPMTATPNNVEVRPSVAVDELSEDVTNDKVTSVMNLLSERQSGNLIGQEKVAELRRALVDAREALRTEARGAGIQTTEFTPPIPRTTVPEVTAAVPPPVAPKPETVYRQAIPEGDSKDVLRRCSALLRAHIHGSLTGNDLVTLRNLLTDSLKAISLEAEGGGEQPSDTIGKNSDLENMDDAEGDCISPDVVDRPTEGMQSVGGIIRDMGLGNAPEKFEPDSKETYQKPEHEQDEERPKHWVSEGLSAEQKRLATRGLGYLLKHRGGAGYGRGRVKGVEAENMVCALAELTETLAAEAGVDVA
ncbi:unnamed protein product [Choristocarpus tenellus]